jgi:hypothetical protein
MTRARESAFATSATTLGLYALKLAISALGGADGCNESGRDEDRIGRRRLIAHAERVGEATAKLQRSSCGCPRRLNGLWSYTMAERKPGDEETLSLEYSLWRCTCTMSRHRLAALIAALRDRC